MSSTTFCFQNRAHDPLVAVPITDTAQMKRLVEFASDTAQLADRRQDLELRVLVEDLHADLLKLMHCR